MQNQVHTQVLLQPKQFRFFKADANINIWEFKTLKILIQFSPKSTYNILLFKNYDQVIHWIGCFILNHRDALLVSIL